MKAAKQNIEEFFEVDMEDEYHIEYGEITDRVMFDMDEGNAMILLDAQEHTINEMRLNIDGMYAEGMKFEQFDYDEVYKILKGKLCKLSEKNISAAKVMYVELQNGELYHGMVRSRKTQKAASKPKSVIVVVSHLMFSLGILAVFIPICLLSPK